MSPSFLDNTLWVAGFLGHIALLAVLVHRGRWKEFPVFSGMICFQAVVSAVLFITLHVSSSRTYYVVYWISALLDYVFQLALILEIARAVLRPTRTWIRDARASFLGWSALGLALATAVVYFVAPGKAHSLPIWEIRSTLFSSVLTLEVFLSMSASANRLGLPWRSHVMALGQGIAALAVANVLGDMGHMHYGWTPKFVIFYRLTDIVYLGTLLFWVYAFWQPERARTPLSKEMQEYLLALHRRVQYDLESQNVENSL